MNIRNHTILHHTMLHHTILRNYDYAIVTLVYRSAPYNRYDYYVTIDIYRDVIAAPHAYLRNR